MWILMRTERLNELGYAAFATESMAEVATIRESRDTVNAI
jgi:hypothetical protein